MNEGRRIIKKAYKGLFEKVTAIFFHYDPIGINFETNTDEYDLETGTILPRLEKETSEADVLDIVYEEFVRWFGSDISGEKSDYHQIATEIFAVWKSWTAAIDRAAD